VADNITIPATGSGDATPLVSTDDCGAGGHAQIVKLAVATGGSATPIPADAGGLLVNLGANNDVTVTGTVDLGATDNAVLDAIAASVAGATPAGTNNIGDVDVLSSVLPTGASTLAEQQSQTTHLATIAGDTTASETAVQIMDDWDNGASDGASISGDVAHDAADAGEPVKIGGKALDLGATPTAVTANDRTNASFLRNGVQVVLGGSVDVVTIEAAYAASAQTDTALVTVSAGTAIVVTQIQALCDEANTVGVGFRVGFAAANTPTTTGVVLTHPGVVPGSGVSRGDGAGILGIGASGEDLRVTAEAATGGSIRFLVTYFTIAIG
jgi:hypothetical protein